MELELVARTSAILLAGGIIAALLRRARSVDASSGLALRNRRRPARAVPRSARTGDQHSSGSKSSRGSSGTNGHRSECGSAFDRFDPSNLEHLEPNRTLLLELLEPLEQLEPLPCLVWFVLLGPKRLVGLERIEAGPGKLVERSDGDRRNEWV